MIDNKWSSHLSPEYTQLQSKLPIQQPIIFCCINCYEATISLPTFRALRIQKVESAHQEILN
jgi:hypothetical protein